MDGTTGVGFMAVFAVSSSVAFVAHQAHKRLVSDFMRQIQFEFGPKQCHHHSKKKARFSNNVMESSSSSSSSNACSSVMKGPRPTNNMAAKPCLRGSSSCSSNKKKNLEGTMPLNRLALYRGIIESRMHFPRDGYGVSKARGFGLFT